MGTKATAAELRAQAAAVALCWDRERRAKGRVISMGTPTRMVPVIVAGNRTIHAGRRIGIYASGGVRYGKLCGGLGRDRHDPGPVAEGTEITCKRCLARLAARGGA